MIGDRSLHVRVMKTDPTGFVVIEKLASDPAHEDGNRHAQEKVIFRASGSATAMIETKTVSV